MSLRSTRILFQAARMANAPPPNPLIAIVGTTGTGKSQLAVDLALRFNGEIINGDAVQMYDGLPIITNKIPMAERKGVPHHLLGCVGLEEPPWTVERFVRAARDAVREIRSRGRMPILVGGTHYYTQSLLFRNGLLDAQPREGEDGASDHEESSDKWPILKSSTEEMLAELRRVDPVMASRWHPNDKRHIRRSLEIWLKTGKRASDVYAEQQQQSSLVDPPAVSSSLDGAPNWKGEGEEEAPLESPGNHTPILHFPTLVLWAYTPKQKLDKRLEDRVEAMYRDGLLAEARQVDDFARQQESEGKAVDKTRGVYIAIGYKEFGPLLDYERQRLEAVLETGACEEARLQKQGIEQTQAATRRYAKAQLRWLRIKLVNALRRAGADHLVYVLDTSDPLAWKEKVVDPAAQYTRDFLEGKRPLSDNYAVSAWPEETLKPARSYDLGQRRDLWQQSVCEICHVVATTAEDWEVHINGSRHKKAARKRARRNAGSLADHSQAG